MCKFDYGKGVQLIDGYIPTSNVTSASRFSVMALVALSLVVKGCVTIKAVEPYLCEDVEFADEMITR
jgi:hypothetical protein